jgi:hypothetical protein
MTPDTGSNQGRIGTDRELLELAAKAAGMNVFTGEWPEGQDGWFFCMQHGLPGMHFAPADNRAHSVGPWRPLTDDGDALRLAVMLRMDIAHFEQPVRVNVNGYDDCCEPIGTNTYAATRRAIVRAAAEVGKGM